MRIQTVIPICRQNKTYARPLSWRGQGRGVDLGQHLSHDSVKVVEVINVEGAVYGLDWNPTPGELLELWETVDTATLWNERNES